MILNFNKIASGKFFDVSPVNYKVSIICNFIKICKVIKLYDFIKIFELTKICKILNKISQQKNFQDYLESFHHNIILNFFY